MRRLAGRGKQGGDLRLLARKLVVCGLSASLLWGCWAQRTPQPATPTGVENTATVTQPAATALPVLTETPLFPAATQVSSVASPSPTVTLSATASPTVEISTPSPQPSKTATEPIATSSPTETQAAPYPGPAASPTQAPYPGPGESPTEAAATPYPGPGEETPAAGITETPFPGPTGSPSPTVRAGTVTATPFGRIATPEISVTATLTISVTPTERVSQPLGTPPPYGGTVRIWHDWSPDQEEALMQVAAAFQESYPDVRFDVMSVPQTDLLARFDAEAYHGRGPTLLIGPSDWTAYLADRQLVENLAPYISVPFKATLNPAALGTGSYRGQQACLPLSVSGVLLYRNTQILPQPAGTVDEMLANAEAATRAGKVGAYLERGFAFSFAHLYGLGGRLLDEYGAPAFQESDYRYSLAWVDLLSSFARPGAYSYNTEQDTSIFKQGRAGYLIDGSWNLNVLAKAIGSENLAVDEWPTIKEGHLSGYVKSTCLYVNVNTYAQYPEDHLATLRFMGYLMTKQVQVFLAEQSFIPSLLEAEPRNLLLKQAHDAFAGGVAYPAVLLSREGALRPIYQDTLDAALADIFEHGIAPKTALTKALQQIQQRLKDLK